MAKLTKKQKEAAAKIEKNKLYTLRDASALIKEVASAKFDVTSIFSVRFYQLYTCFLWWRNCRHYFWIYVFIE